MNIPGFSPESLQAVEALLYGEIDWDKEFKTGKRPAKEKRENYNGGSRVSMGLLGKISRTGPGDGGKQKVNNDSEMLSPTSYPKGPGNPQGGSSKEVFGMRALG
jgi:hypothetical protein